MTAHLVKLQQAPDLVDRVYRALLDAISDGSMSPGTRLTQEDIAARLAVSRQPVLQALRLLKKDGLVVDAPGRGVLVAPLDAAWIAQVYEVRGALDALAVRLAAARRVVLDPRLVETGRRAARGRDIPAMVEADIAFHEAIYAASGNPLIGASARLHWVHLRRVMGAVLQQSRQREALWDEHAAIADAIARGDADGAARLIDHHGRRASENLLAQARRRPRPTDPERSLMKLTPEQHAQFERDGYLFFPGLFSSEETKTLTAAVPELYSRREAYNVREKGKDAVRTNFAAHLYSEPFARLARHPRMVEPVQELIGEALYMHQFKINGKQAFDGDVWQWHQDYGTWKNDDLMPAERAMNVAIFLDDVNDYNGPLMFIPGSHKRGVVDARHDLTTTSYPLWTIDNALIAQLVERAGGKNGGIVSPKGPAGSMILFHGCLVHASGSNLSPWDRVSVYLSLCAVSNHIRRFKRPEYIAHRDFTPIDCLPDDCLLKSYPVELPWKNGMPASALETSIDELKIAA